VTVGWHFEHESEEGGADADAYRNTLAGVGVPSAELFAREAVQNSVDAHDATAGSTVRVRFERRLLEGSRFSSLVNGIRVGDGPGNPLSRPGLLTTANRERDLRSALVEPLRILVVEDFNTFGLTGVEKQAKLTAEDRFRRLCMKLGSTPEPQAGRGGTFGYGKAVYWTASSLWTVLFYSTFRPSARSDGAHARFLGVSWFRAHVFPPDRPNDPSAVYTGRAFLGERRSGRVAPLVEEDAHRLAESVGFQRRTEAGTGLSVMILGCDLDIDGLREGIQRTWWPRILDDRLDVELIDHDGRRHEVNPLGDPRLARYVRGWNLVRRSDGPANLETLAPVTYRRDQLGLLAISVGPDPEAEPFPEADEKYIHVAQVRSPGMVVRYEEGPHLGPGHPTCAGVFLADDCFDETLATSEPPAHDRWDPDTTRAERPLSESDRAKIRHLKKRVREIARGFIREHREAPPRPPDRCEELERMLGRFLATERSRPTPPLRSADPFSVAFEEPTRSTTDRGTVLQAVARISLSENCAEASLPVRITAWAETLLDHGSPGDPLVFEAAEISGVSEVPLAPEAGFEEISATVVLTESESAHVRLTTAPLPHEDYLARVSLDVRVVRAEAVA
jgi:hypothetical protein